MNIKEAYKFYKKFILNEDKNILLQKYGFASAGSVNFVDWELFCAILFNKNKQNIGPDLGEYEVKSAKKFSSFEYQYHKKSGLTKIQNDQKVNHIYISYDEQYKNVIIREINGDIISSKFQVWAKELKENYSTDKQRFRKSIPYGFVKKHGRIIAKIKNGNLSK